MSAACNFVILPAFYIIQKTSKKSWLVTGSFLSNKQAHMVCKHMLFLLSPTHVSLERRKHTVFWFEADLNRNECFRCGRIPTGKNKNDKWAFWKIPMVSIVDIQNITIYNLFSLYSSFCELNTLFFQANPLHVTSLFHCLECEVESHEIIFPLYFFKCVLLVCYA